MAGNSNTSNNVANTVIEMIGGETDPCAICYRNMDDNADNIVTTPCNHRFHRQCLALARQHGSTVCPLCRELLTPQQQPREITEFDWDEPQQQPRGSSMRGREITELDYERAENPEDFPSDGYMPFGFDEAGAQAQEQEQEQEEEEEEQEVTPTQWFNPNARPHS